ncbi:hypothetical protein [Curtobacterium sp. MCPF17_021]|uniref:hypothetical protein n=1 Tax=Curtobacterium sp. MCPF17_021 TaxID=2175639 RepID=UPI0011B7F381|nr:hypothetical protein [Curtobacterium sp. MCPF17_021]WIE85140.1 hypothetical protein DEJ29_018110 [Curtobacterium sp. MCPF17_021]
MVEAIRMMSRDARGMQEGQLSRGDLLAIWILFAVGIVAVLFSAGYVFNENLYAYGLCWAGPRTGCGDGPWFSSMGLSLFGGIAAVAAGAVLGLRRHRRGLVGFWFPLAALGAVTALAGLSLVILRITTPL